MADKVVVMSRNTIVFLTTVYEDPAGKIGSIE